MFEKIEYKILLISHRVVVSGKQSQTSQTALQLCTPDLELEKNINVTNINK